MAGICFYFEDNDIDVYSGRRIDLDSWNYAEKAAGDINQVIIINHSSIELQVINNYKVVKDPPELSGKIVHICCPWDIADKKICLWDFDHDVDWYLFGPASGWYNKKIETGVYIPISGAGAFHSVHAATVVLAHRFGVLQWQ